MKNYFDYFDMVYFINLPSRTDRYTNVMLMFEKLNITKYKHIIPPDPNTIGNEFLLSKTAQSCTLSHLDCYNDAVINNYQKICIFEDDFCFHETINAESNKELHLEICFNFLENYDWDLFYFDNMSMILKENNRPIFIMRSPENNLLITKIEGKRFTHSYAISNLGCQKMINILTTLTSARNRHIDQSLQEVNLSNKYMYSAGLFDQKLNIVSDNIW